MKRRTLASVLLLALLLATLPASANAAPRCFPETAPAIQDCIDGRIASFWQEQGGLPVFGYPIGPAHQEQTAAGSLTTQFFERARLELHPKNARPYDVLLGRLGADALAQQGRDWTAFDKADPAAAHYFPQTGHAIAPQFWSYWASRGLEFDGKPGKSFAESLALFGLPLSEATMETSPTDGRQYLTQWFERARFEQHPENAGTANEVLLGLLQRELLAGGSAAPVPPAQPATSVTQPGGFIEVAGSQLTRLGQPVLIKGVNYYPQWRPWATMWRSWNGVQVERELRQARDQLGINAVRVLVPYNFSGVEGEAGKVGAKQIDRLRQMAQIAGALDMRLIVTLFDFNHTFAAPGSAAEERDFNYLRQILSNFAEDERIFAWDLHNEPDHYGQWNDDAQAVLSWLGRMADAAHSLAPHQLVTVGMGQHANLWKPGPDGRTVLDYSDVVSFHTYDAGAVARQLDEVRAHTAKPILVEEFGWPTGPDCMENYTEATQAGLYRDVLAAAKERTAGVLAWTLRDYDPALSERWDSREEYFGLYRPDGGLKPAAEAFRAVPAPPLPSATITHISLTTSDPPFPSDADSALLIPGSNHYVKGSFRKAWELFGGQGSLGLPITEALQMPDGRVVQYFEAAVLERHPEASGAPQYSHLSDADKIARLIQPADLGSAAIAGRTFQSADRTVSGAFRDFYDAVNGAWRLGAPLSPELVEPIDGVPTRVQYFERGRMEWDATAQVVRMGLLGREAWDAQCRATREG